MRAVAPIPKGKILHNENSIASARCARQSVAGVHCGSFSRSAPPPCMRRYQSGQFASRCPVRFSVLAVCSLRTPKALARSFDEAKAVSARLDAPGQPGVISCNSHPLPSGSTECRKELVGGVIRRRALDATARAVGLETERPASALHYSHTPSEGNNRSLADPSFVAAPPRTFSLGSKDSTKYAATGGWGVRSLQRRKLEGDNTGHRRMATSKKVTRFIWFLLQIESVFKTGVIATALELGPLLFA